LRGGRAFLAVELSLSGWLDFGALPAGFVSFRGVSRTRVLAVLCATAGMAVSTFVGATTAASLPWLLVPAESEAAGLFAATDGLVDAINTAAHVLRD
jgi:hypothetical protein